jgi:hypothetical protein
LHHRTASVSRTANALLANALLARVRVETHCFKHTT